MVFQDNSSGFNVVFPPLCCGVQEDATHIRHKLNYIFGQNVQGRTLIKIANQNGFYCNYFIIRHCSVSCSYSKFTLLAHTWFTHSCHHVQDWDVQSAIQLPYLGNNSLWIEEQSLHVKQTTVWSIIPTQTVLTLLHIRDSRLIYCESRRHRCNAVPWSKYR